MIISAVPAPSRAGAAPTLPHRPQPLWTVFRWELHRLAASRTLWISALLVFALTCLIEVGLSTNPDTTTFPSDFGTRTVKIDWLSNYGLFHNLPFFLGMVLALFIPFLCTDGVALDLTAVTAAHGECRPRTTKRLFSGCQVYPRPAARPGRRHH